MIDITALPNGDVQLQIDGNTETIQSATVSAFISVILGKMSQQAEQSGDVIPEGGAIIYPSGAAIEYDRESGEPRLQLTFGKALFVLSLPKGEIKKIADGINQVIASRPA